MIPSTKIFSYISKRKCPATFSWEERRNLWIKSKNYLIIANILYRRVVDSIIHCCLSHEEVEFVLNDSYSGTCGGHLYGSTMTHKILHVSYLWPTIFKYCMEVVKRCHPCQLYTRKMLSSYSSTSHHCGRTLHQVGGRFHDLQPSIYWGA